MKKGMTASSLRNILVAAVFIALAATSAGFYFALDWIKGYTEEVNTVIVASADSGDTVSSINVVQEQLDRQQEIITAANNLFALSSNYQTQAITDVYSYAQKTGISVADLSFGADGAGASNTRPVNISLEGKVPYTNLLRFLSYIETNKPKMQVNGLEIARPSDGSSNVDISSISLGVYVR